MGVIRSSAAALVVLLARTAVLAQDVRAPGWWLDRVAAEVERFPDVAEKADPTFEALGIQDRTRRADLLAGLADARARAGDRADALRAVAACAEAMRKTPSSRRDATVHAQLAGVHARLGDVEAARRSVDSAFTACAEFAKSDPAKAGQYREELETQVMWHFADAGAYDEALARARRIATASGKAYALERIAESQHKAGLKDAARATMAEAEIAVRKAMGEVKESERPYELGTLCDGLIEVGDLGGAERVVGELPLKERVSQYTTLAARYFDAKNAAASRRLGKAALDALGGLAADELTVALEGPRLAGFFMFTGDKASAEQALALVKTGDSALTNIQMHYGVALLHARNGNVAAAREQVDLAREAEAVERRSRLGELSTLLSAMQPWPAKVAQAHVNAGHPEEALRLLELYKDDEAYGASLQTVVVMSKAATGDLEAVKRGLDKLEPGLFGRELARTAAIKALVRRADEKGLRELAAWVESLPDAMQRMNSYLAVCDELTEKGKGER